MPKELYLKHHKNFSGPRSLKLDRWLVLHSVLERFGVESVLEFGSGLSTLLFEELGISVVSLETNSEWLNEVGLLSNGLAKLVQWDNKNYPLEYPRFDLAFVDGDVPRMRQTEIAQMSAGVVVMDDWGYGDQQRGWSTQGCKGMFDKWIRVDGRSTILAVFMR